MFPNLGNSFVIVQFKKVKRHALGKRGTEKVRGT